MATNEIVRIPSGKKEPERDFLNASLDYFDNVFAKICPIDMESGVMIPPTCPRRIVGPVGPFASGSLERMDFVSANVKREVDSAFKGDETMFAIWSTFDKLRRKVPNFICLSEFGYNEQLRQLLAVNYRIRLDAEENYDVDFLILHPNKGVLLVEVKAVENFAKGFSHYIEVKKSGKSSLKKMQSMIDGLQQLFNVNGIENVCFKKIVAFPNCEMKPKPDYINLDMNSSKDENLLAWWNAIPNVDQDGGDNALFKKVVSMVLALRCKLKATISETKNVDIFNQINPKAHRGKKIESLERQLFLEDNELKQVKHLSKKEMKKEKEELDKRKLLMLQKTVQPEKLPDQISNVGDEKPISNKELIVNIRNIKEMHKKSKTYQEANEKPAAPPPAFTTYYYFLSPEQIAIFEGSILQIIEGPPGSGKSLLLQYQALDLAQHGQKVYIFAPSPMAAKYREFFDNVENLPKELVRITDYTTFFGCWPNNANDFEGAHLFFDDFFNDWSSFKPANNELFLDLVAKTRSDANGIKYFCWIACDSHQMGTGNNFRPEQLEFVKTLTAGTPPVSFPTAGACYPTFQHHVLYCVMRCATNIAREYCDRWEPLNPDDKRPICVGNNESGRLVTKLTIQHRFLVERISDMLKAMKEKEQYDAKEIAIIQCCRQSLIGHDVRKEIEEKSGFEIFHLRGIKERLPNNWQDTIKVDTCNYTYSMEWPCVIVLLDENDEDYEKTVKQWKYVAFSRAMYCLICVTVGKSEEMFNVQKSVISDEISASDKIRVAMLVDSDFLSQRLTTPSTNKIGSKQLLQLENTFVDEAAAKEKRELNFDESELDALFAKTVEQTLKKYQGATKSKVKKQIMQVFEEADEETERKNTERKNTSFCNVI